MTILTPTPKIQIDSADQFFIENHHPDKNLRFVWAKHPYVVGPSMKKIVPFEIVCLYFGDPRSVINKAVPYKDSRGSGTVPERYGELRRLSVRYGVYEQGMEDIAAAVTVENERLKILDSQTVQPVKLLIDDNFYAQIKTLEGELILPPLFDPTGQATYGYQLDDQNSSDLAVIIETLQRKVAVLEGQKSGIDQMGGSNSDVGIPIDNPGTLDGAI